MLTTSQNPDVNYLAQVVRLDKLEKHPNADKLQIATVNFTQVITGLDAEIGALYVHFPVECQIEPKFLSYTNSYSDAEKNRDIKVKGYFPKNSRVKMVKLRGTYSEGYIVPVSVIEEYIAAFYPDKFKITEEFVNVSFDSICGDRFVKKFVRHVQQPNNPSRKSKGNVKKYETKLVEGQFRFHEDTENIRKNIAKIMPDDFIAVTNKIHGCNFIVANVLTKKKLRARDKVAKWLGLDVNSVAYGNLYASRAVIKNQNFDPKDSKGFYDTDIWKIVSDRVFPLLDFGITVVGEIYGFTPSGAAIQPGYDYGCPPKELDFVVFKVTYTAYDGQVYVMSHPQAEAYCLSKGIDTPETFYYGKARDLFPDLDVHNHWHEGFLKNLEAKFLEKKCWLCNNDVWAEGICVRKDTPLIWDALKLKSKNFLGYETQLLDSNELSAEEQEANMIENS